MRLEIDDARCQGHVQCWGQAPDLIEIDDEEGHARARVVALSPEQLAAARLAEQACPERAISVVE
jgi:ferredoxin